MPASLPMKSARTAIRSRGIGRREPARGRRTHGVSPRIRSEAARDSVPQEGHGYLFDIFISYKRDPETRIWIEKHLRPLLNTHVGYEVGRPLQIFIDDQLETGANWPIQLGENLARSRILLALWSKPYFSSKWCVLEMSHMLARDKHNRRRAKFNAPGLVCPVVIH